MARPGVAERPARRVVGGALAPVAQDAVAVEEPLEIRVAGEAVAITMRTPGADAQLAAGFLFAEGIVRSVDDLGTLSHCGRVGEEGYGNVLDVLPAPGVTLDLERVQATRRGTLTTAACGVCGRRSVEDLLARVPELAIAERVPRELVARGPDLLRAAQGTFSRTGGTHAAALLGADGAVLAVHEDVGRHNAVDKVVGTLLLASRLGRPRTPAPGGPPLLLVVSGRSSFEMVQKAAVARIPVLASVGAASTLAIDLAERAGVTLAAFVRNGTLNVYAHPERLL
ncbi:MAG TPA: formate dehydrogenase accessory sulfurtransferase FdhD [Myxococcaceae bacterium]|nr:formate dehydrogenase accessory sulfurtransferase FdhD [Myxococcaceae bacterium]